MKIRGSFDAELKPADIYATGTNGVRMNRLTLNKTYYGDLDAVSKGEMLNAMTSTEGSAGYVAIEQVEGTLSGKKGTFVLQHYGTMAQGKQNLILEVIPDSGTGELSGLSGSMNIIHEEGKKYYEFEFSFGFES